MSAVIIPLPRTQDGRALLRYALTTNRPSSADFRVYLAQEFDWDDEAEELRGEPWFADVMRQVQ